MPHTWYEAVCEEHKQRCPILIVHSVADKMMLPYDVEDSEAFLQLHYGCELYLIWRDDQLDKCNDKGIYREKLQNENKETKTV